MSAVVKLASALPGDFETNGLDAQAPALLDDPKALRVAVIWFDVAKVTEDVDSGAHVPTVRVRRIEPLGEAGDVTQAVKDIVGEAMQERTGRSPIPFDIAEVVEGHDPDQLELGDEA